MADQITILLVDPNNDSRQSLAAELIQYQYCVKTATCTHEARQLLRESFDLVITDIDLPLRPKLRKESGAGLELGRSFREVAPSTGLLFYCADENHIRVAEDLYRQGLGGVGYIAKNADVRVAAAVPAVASGNWVCAVTKSYTAGISEDWFLRGLVPTARERVLAAAQKITKLSEDERRTLGIMGHSNEAIAQTMHVHVKTVENHFTRIYQALDLDDLDRRLRTMLLDRAIIIHTLRGGEASTEAFN